MILFSEKIISKNLVKNEIKKHDKESNNNFSSNNESGNDNNINNFGIGDDENFGSMLNESDGFDKLINQLKKEKIEEDRNYEKQQKEKLKQNEKNKVKEEEYDLNNLVYNFENTNINKIGDNDYSNKETKKEEDNLFNRRKNDKNELNDNKINKEQNNKNKVNQNRRGNARHFLEETENYGGFNFGESPKKKSNDINLNNDFGNLNLGNSGEFGSLFGNKSRRRQDKNYEI